jgi:hypothetical protein
VGSVCAGIVEQVYIPSPSTVDKSLAPLLPPFVLQAIQEQVLASIENMIPRYLSSSCLLAQRKIMCSMFFLSPHADYSLVAMFGGPVYIPSFPQRDVCTQYSTECASMIATAPSAAIDCQTNVSSTIKFFPTKSQTIVTIPVNAYYSIFLNSPPHYFNASTASISSQCPLGLVVPNKPSKKNIIWITGMCINLFLKLIF